MYFRLLENQFDWIKIVDVAIFSIFESVLFLLIQTLHLVVNEKGKKLLQLLYNHQQCYYIVLAKPYTKLIKISF